MRDPGDNRFKPVDRRWNLVGMIVGTAVGALPAAIPAPVGPLIMWIAFGIFIGFMVPFAAALKHFSFDEIRHPKKAWFLGGLGGGIGGLAWYFGEPLGPGEGSGAQF